MVRIVYFFFSRKKLPKNINKYEKIKITSKAVNPMPAKILMFPTIRMDVETSKSKKNRNLRIVCV